MQESSGLLRRFFRIRVPSNCAGKEAAFLTNVSDFAVANPFQMLRNLICGTHGTLVSWQWEKWDESKNQQEASDSLAELGNSASAITWHRSRTCRWGTGDCRA